MRTYDLLTNITKKAIVEPLKYYYRILAFHYYWFISGIRPWLRALSVWISRRLCDHSFASLILGMVRVCRCVHPVQISREVIILYTTGCYLHSVVRLDACARSHSHVRYSEMDSREERLVCRRTHYGFCPYRIPREIFFTSICVRISISFCIRTT